MYLTRGARIACATMLVLSLLLLALALVELLGEGADKQRTHGMAALFFFAFFMAIPGVVYLIYLFSEASKKAYQTDILQSVFHIERVPEVKGVQWVLLGFPDRMSLPGYVVVAILLQNAHSRPRRVRVRLHAGGREQEEVVLKGGEMGILRIPVLLDRIAPSSELEVKVEIRAWTLEGVGKRVIRREGITVGAGSSFRKIHVETAERHTDPPLNLAAREWRGFAPLYVTGQAEVDLEPIRLLESLSGSPS